MYLVPEDIADRQREYRPVVIRGVVKIQYLSGYGMQRDERLHVVTRNFAASLFRNIKYFTLRKLYLCRKWMQKRLQKTIKTGITLPNFDFLA